MTTRFRGAGAVSRAVAIQDDGKIVVAGGADDGRRFAVARYLPNGTLDGTFGKEGKVTARFSAGGNFARAVAIAKDGTILVAGQTSHDNGSWFAVLRLLSDGSRDSSFGHDGRVTTQFGGVAGDAYGVAIQGNGRIVVVGEGLSDGGFCLARYRSDGRLDRGFGDAGTVVSRSPGGARAVALQDDGRIVVGGIGGDIFGPFALERYESDGHRDPTFSGNGRLTVSMGDGEESGQAVMIQEDGKIVEVGYTNVPHEFGDTGNGGFALVRVRPGGALDRSFGVDGKLVTEFSEGVSLGLAGALQPNGKIVAAGWDAGNFGLARYLAA